ncbi:fumarylacetoacetate hydrolase family protein [uncultured Paracoccus sp.]|uniref:fumarylacetoacetate hydrolase family protein n=1 Tax=uncultured Paracoccus sp. TaxID=189685 RepID=UPI00263136E9|nr:fumarylacetoacetate hydrolase family protein [uncultured Paracoccus sp.]
MKLAAFEVDGRTGLARVEGDELAVLHEGEPGAALLSVIEGRSDATAPALRRIRLDDVRLLPPAVSSRATILCVGKNYHAHAKEFFGSGFDSTGREEVPTQPVIFGKTGSCLVGKGAEVRASLDPTGSVDYEGELALVIGKKAQQVSRKDAYDCIFGYTIFNDVTSRELQKRHNQWLIGKSLDTFGPLGPWIVTSDEIGDVSALELLTKINGEVRQQAKVADLVFDIPTLIETLTATMTLQPGDIIATGTPAGVGIGFQPPRFLKKGDRMEVSISGIGTLSNPVV